MILSLAGLRPTWTEVDLAQVEANYQALRRYLPAHVKIMGVIKADAYGHGATPVAQRLERLKIDALAVAILEEALALRAASVHCPILLLNGFWPGQEDEIVRHDIIPAIYRLDLLERLQQAASRAGRNAAYHLKINTGMSRLGVDWDEALAFLRRDPASPCTHCEGIYTHLSSAEDAQSASTQAQLDRFKAISAAVEQRGLPLRWRHAANSAAILNFKQSWFDGVRPGLVLYGVSPLSTPPADLRLAPVLAFKTRIMQVRNVKNGSSIGYGDAYTVRRDSVIATLPVGYADGLMRALSNRGQALVRGQRVPIVGRISMDLTLIDVTELPAVEVGDEVVLIGTQGSEAIRVEDVARVAETIPYEILCRLGTRVPRIYLGD